MRISSWVAKPLHVCVYTRNTRAGVRHFTITTTIILITIIIIIIVLWAKYPFFFLSIIYCYSNASAHNVL